MSDSQKIANLITRRGRPALSPEDRRTTLHATVDPDTLRKLELLRDKWKMRGIGWVIDKLVEKK